MRIREPGTCTDNLAVCSRACISIRLGDHTGRLKLVWAQPALAGEAATKHPVATAPPFPAKDLWRVVPRCAACDALTAPPAMNRVPFWLGETFSDSIARPQELHVPGHHRLKGVVAFGRAGHRVLLILKQRRVSASSQLVPNPVDHVKSLSSA